MNDKLALFPSLHQGTWQRVITPRHKDTFSDVIIAMKNIILMETCGSLSWLSSRQILSRIKSSFLWSVFLEITKEGGFLFVCLLFYFCCCCCFAFLNKTLEKPVKKQTLVLLLLFVWLVGWVQWSGWDPRASFFLSNYSTIEQRPLPLVLVLKHVLSYIKILNKHYSARVVFRTVSMLTT